MGCCRLKTNPKGREALSGVVDDQGATFYMQPATTPPHPLQRDTNPHHYLSPNLHNLLNTSSFSRQQAQKRLKKKKDVSFFKSSSQDHAADGFALAWNPKAEGLYVMLRLVGTISGLLSSPLVFVYFTVWPPAIQTAKLTSGKEAANQVCGAMQIDEPCEWARGNPFFVALSTVDISRELY